MGIPDNKGFVCYVTGSDTNGINFLIPTKEGMQRCTVRIGPDGESPIILASAFRELADWCEEHGATEEEMEIACAELESEDSDSDKEVEVN